MGESYLEWFGWPGRITENGGGYLASFFETIRIRVESGGFYGLVQADYFDARPG